MTDISLLHAQNSAFLDDLYSDYLENPEKVPEDWRQFFAEIGRASCRERV